MNILFTSVGRRVELIQEFIKAREKNSFDVQIIGGDLSDTAPALFFCDTKITLKPIHDPDYIPDLLKKCSEYKVDLLIPTIDTDLLLLADSRKKFAQIGTIVLISAPDKIKICRDKRATAGFFEECGLKTPHPVDGVCKYNDGFPCFIKPLDGSSSIDAYKIDNADDLNAQSIRIDNYIIQPYIAGTEYTVDIFCDFYSKPLIVSPRIRVATRSGEVIKTKICNDPKIIEECNRIVTAFKPIGPLTVQLIREDKSGDDYYIEINPRYGGGAPLSMRAGANSADILLRLLNKQKVKSLSAQNNLFYCRFDQSICLNNRRQYKAVIFDLDDTLYSEKEYIKSGFHAVETYLIAQNYCVDVDKGELWSMFCNDEPRPINNLLCRKGILSDSLLTKCVEEYRNHKPDIHLYDGISATIKELRRHGITVAILTDGRPVGQRAKIEALGVSDMFDEILITDELGGVHCRKPSDVGFRFLQSKIDLPFEDMLYIGDNFGKDFVAPNHLGMGHLFFNNPDGIYHSTRQSGITALDVLLTEVNKLVL